MKTKIEPNKIYCGDCLEMMKDIADNSIDFISTDPPYMISSEVIIGRSSNWKYKGKSISQDFGDWDRQWESKEDYIEWCKRWLKECVRVLKSYRHLVFFFDKAKISYMWDFLETLDMKMRSSLFWLKTNPVPRSRKIDFMKAIEMMIWATKEKIKQDYFNWQLGQHADYFTHCIVGHTTESDGRRSHPCQKPVALNRWLISYLSKENDVILDPFIGTGSTAIACKQQNRRYIGIEINPEYCKIAEDRLLNTDPLFHQGEM